MKAVTLFTIAAAASLGLALPAAETAHAAAPVKKSAPQSAKKAQSAPVRKTAAKTSARTPAKTAATASKTPAKTASKTAPKTVTKTAAQKSAVKTPVGSPRNQKAGLESQQKQLEQQIGQLNRDISQKQNQRNQEAAAAKNAQQALSLSNQKLAQLDSEKKQKQNQLASIRKQSGEVRSDLTATRRDIAANAKLQYLYANSRPWDAFVSGDTPSEMNRASAVLSYLAAEHRERADKLEDTQDALQNREQKTVSLVKTISANAANEKASNQKIAAEEEKHQANTRALASQIEDQKKKVAELRRDQQRLSALITQINAVIAAQEKAKREQLAREKRERERQAALAKKRAEDASRRGKTVKPAPAPKEEPLPADTSSAFAKLRGRLPLPVSGTIAARYGQARAGAGTWQGLFIEAPSGSTVSAVADGRVVYTGNLRGFGNLIILDHGGGYLSVYAYNSALLKGTGAAVSARDPIARVGSGASGDTPGLYFEIRYKGKTVNPSAWVR